MYFRFLSLLLFLFSSSAWTITNPEDLLFLKTGYAQLFVNNQCHNLFEVPKQSTYSLKFIRFILNDEDGRLSTEEEKTHAQSDLDWYILNKPQKVPLDLLYFKANLNPTDTTNTINSNRAKLKAQQELTLMQKQFASENLNLDALFKDLESIEYMDKHKLQSLEALAQYILLNPINEIPDEALFLVSRLESRAQDYYLITNFLLGMAKSVSLAELKNRESKFNSNEFLKKSIFAFFIAPERLSEQELQQLLNLDPQTTFSKYIHEQVMSYLSRLRYAQ